MARRIWPLIRWLVLAAVAATETAGLLEDFVAWPERLRVMEGYISSDTARWLVIALLAAGFLLVDIQKLRRSIAGKIPWGSIPRTLHAVGNSSPPADMPIRDAVEHITGRDDPDYNEAREALHELRQAASDGASEVWGRIRQTDLDLEQHGHRPLTRIERSYWGAAAFDERHCLTGGPDGCRTTPDHTQAPERFPTYQDVRVNSDQIKKGWPKRAGR